LRLNLPKFVALNSYLDPLLLKIYNLGKIEKPPKQRHLSAMI
jgi:hypothetical protein